MAQTLKFKRKLIIFDLDGVLINSLPNMKYALKNTANHIKQKISFKKYKKYIGLPFEKILKELNVKGNYNRIKHLYSVYSLKRIVIVLMRFYEIGIDRNKKLSQLINQELNN